MALKFIAIFGIMGIPIFISLATCNEVCSCHISIPPTLPSPSVLVQVLMSSSCAGRQAVCEAQAVQHAERPSVEVRTSSAHWQAMRKALQRLTI